MASKNWNIKPQENSSPGDTFEITADNVAMLQITDTGNVGIGKVPAGTARLEVAGAVQATAFTGDGGPLTVHGTTLAAALSDRVLRTGDTFSGAVTLQSTLSVTAGMTLGDEAVIHFGNTTRQMLNLWGTELGIGIQDGTQYFRTGKNFAWYKGGAHNDGELDAGGGTVQMVLQDGHVGIGTAHPGARLQIVDQNGDAHGTTLVLGPMDQSNLRLGYHADYSWVQSHGSKPLAINPLGNGVSIGTTHPQGAQLAISSSSANDGNNTAVFLAPNLGPNASHIHYGKTGDWYIRSASGNGTVHIQDTGGGVAFGGELSFTARPFVFARYTFGDNPNVTTGFSVNDYCAAIVGFWGERSSGIDLAFGMGVYMYNNGGTWWVRADVLGVTERWAVVDVMFIKRAWVDDRR